MIDYPAIAQRLERGEFRSSIARELGVNSVTLYLGLKKRGLPTSSKTPRMVPTQYELHVLRLSEAGLPAHRIAKAFDTSKEAVRTALWKAKKKMEAARV